MVVCVVQVVQTRAAERRTFGVAIVLVHIVREEIAHFCLSGESPARGATNRKRRAHAARRCGKEFKLRYRQ